MVQCSRSRQTLDGVAKTAKFQRIRLPSASSRCFSSLVKRHLWKEDVPPYSHRERAFLSEARNEDHGVSTGRVNFSSGVAVLAVCDGAVGRSSRVAPSFCLGCVAIRRPSNWLHRRFYRAVLSRPLETSQGDPTGRTATREGGRTAPSITQTTCDVVLLLQLTVVSTPTHFRHYTSFELGGG